MESYRQDLVENLEKIRDKRREVKYLRTANEAVLDRLKLELGLRLI
jgi:hypothetical protein